VLADAVESHLLGEHHVAAQRLIVRRGEAAVGPLALIEHQPQIVRPAVEHEAIAPHADRPQRGEARHGVDSAAAFTS
jgi:hypothetical protein